MARKWLTVTDPEDFPEPPRYLVWRNRTRVSIFDQLSLIKAAVSSETYHDDVIRNEYLIYEWDGTGWQGIYEIPRGSNRLEHPLWKNGVAPKHKQVVSDEDVEAAIQSIIGKG